MAKLDRVAQSIFAILSGVSDVEQFGSFANGGANFTKDPAVIQALAKWKSGWQSAIVGGANPNIEDMNAVLLVLSYQLAYLFQQGIPEWNVDTTYFIGSFVTVNGTVYLSLTNDNLGNLVTDPTNWKNYIFSVGASIWCGTSTLTGNNYAVTPTVAIPNPVPAGTTINFKVDANNLAGVTRMNVGNGQGDVVVHQTIGKLTGGFSALFANQFIIDDTITLIYDDAGFWAYAGNRIGYVPSLIIGGGAGAATNVLTAGTTDDFVPNTPWNASFGAIQIATNAPGTFNLTGIVATRTGHVLILMNSGPGDIVLKNDTGSAGGNRFFANADYTLSPNTAVSLYLDTIGWLVLGR